MTVFRSLILVLGATASLEGSLPVLAQTSPREGFAARRPAKLEPEECTDACGTQVLPENLEALYSLAPASSAELAPSSHVFRVPVAIHVVRRTNGTGGLSPETALASLADANEYFAAAGIQFCPLEEPIFVDDDAYFDCVCGVEIEFLRAERRVEDAVNLYFVPRLVSGSPLCGLATLPGTGNPGVLLQNSCTVLSGDSTTIAHELGHFLGLLHTHENAFGVECANGSNCDVSGDLVCDTPADPNLQGRVTAGCVYTGPATGSCPGDTTPLRPLVENLMSYSRPGCRRSFTRGQIERMRVTLVRDRPELARFECPQPAKPAHGELVCVSTSTAGVPANGPSRAPQIAANGAHVVFLSQATNLVATPVDGPAQVYVRDLRARGLELVSRGIGGAPAADVCSSARISADGRYVAFESLSRNLVPEVHGPLLAGNVFLRDRVAGTTRLVSRAPDGGGTDAFFQEGTCGLSADGRFVAFSSYATNLVPVEVPAGVSQIYLADVQSGVLELASVDASGAPGNQWSQDPALSSDGRYLVFSSFASNLDPRDPDELADVYLYDRTTRVTRLVSIDEQGRRGFGQALTPSVSADGRRVAFELAALGPWKDDLTTVRGDIAVKDFVTGQLLRASENARGRTTVFDSDAPALSADGRFVAFRSRANEFEPVPLPLADYDVWVKDLATGALHEASVLEVESFGPAHPEVSIDARGSAVAFASEARNLVPGDGNGASDVFVRFLSR